MISPSQYKYPKINKSEMESTSERKKKKKSPRKVREKPDIWSRTWNLLWKKRQMVLDATIFLVAVGTVASMGDKISDKFLAQLPNSEVVLTELPAFMSKYEGNSL